MTKGIILLVEDNEDDIELTRRAFVENRIRNALVVVRDGDEALQWLERTGPYALRDRAEIPDLVLLDLKLPKRSGHEVLARLRANDETRFLPVVILTSSREENDVIRSYLGGANSFIQKPIDFPQFVEAVRTLGLYWLVLNRGALHGGAAIP